MGNNISGKKDMLEAKQSSVTIHNSYILENENVTVDVSMLYDVSGNDKNFIYKTVGTFLRNMPDTLNKIQSSLNNQDWEGVYKSAHSAKSSFSVIKIGGVLDWLVQIEDYCRNKTSLDSVPELLKKIKERYFFAEKILNESFPTKDEIS